MWMQTIIYFNCILKVTDKCYAASRALHDDRVVHFVQTSAVVQQEEQGTGILRFEVHSFTIAFF